MTDIAEMTDRQLMDEVRQLAKQSQWRYDAKVLLELVRRFESRCPQDTRPNGETP